MNVTLDCTYVPDKIKSVRAALSVTALYLEEQKVKAVIDARARAEFFINNGPWYNRKIFFHISPNEFIINDIKHSHTCRSSWVSEGVPSDRGCLLFIDRHSGGYGERLEEFERTQILVTEINTFLKQLEACYSQGVDIVLDGEESRLLNKCCLIATKE